MKHKTKIYISTHARKQWTDRLGLTDPTHIRKTIKSAMRQNPLIPAKRTGYFYVALRGTLAVLALAEKGWVLVTVLPRNSEQVVRIRKQKEATNK